MRILLLTQWFDPEPAFKGLLFAKKLQAAGHDVEVLTGFPNYPGGKVYPGFKIKPYQRDVMDGITVHRVALYPSHDDSGGKRILNYASFAATASVAALFVRKPDVVYVYHPPASVAAPALVLRWFRGIPFVYDIQDLWPDTLAATGMMNNPKVLDAVELWMQLVYRQASRITVLSRGFEKRLQQRGVLPEKLIVIPNWTDEAQIQSSSDPQKTIRALGLNGKFIIVFAGTMGKAQALETILSSARILHDTDPEVHFVLIGGGIEVENLKRLAGDLPNVTFLPRRSPSEIGEILDMAGALLVHLKNDPLFEITVPSKTQAYLRAGKPILMGVNGDAAQMVQEAGAGVVFVPENALSLVEAVRKLRGLPTAERTRMGRLGQEFYQQNLSLERGVNSFLAVFDEVRSDAKSRRWTWLILGLLCALAFAGPRQKQRK